MKTTIRLSNLLFEKYPNSAKKLVEILKEKPVIQIPMDEGLFNIGSA